MGVPRAILTSSQTRFRRGLQANGPRSPVVFCSTVPRIAGFHGRVRANRSIAYDRIAAAGILHVRYHRLEFFCQLPDPSLPNVSRERRSLPENLLPEVDRPLEPGQHELTELLCSTARALCGDCGI